MKTNGWLVEFCRTGLQNIVIAAKTAAPHPTLPGTIHTAAKECEEAGAPKALAIQCDIMDDAAIERMVAATVGEFGGIDILINNAAAIDNSGTLDVRAKKYHLMHQINGLRRVRGYE